MSELHQLEDDYDYDLELYDDTYPDIYDGFVSAVVGVASAIFAVINGLSNPYAWMFIIIVYLLYFLYEVHVRSPFLSSSSKASDTEDAYMSDAVDFSRKEKDAEKGIFDWGKNQPPPPALYYINSPSAIEEEQGLMQKLNEQFNAGFDIVDADFFHNRFTTTDITNHMVPMIIDTEINRKKVFNQMLEFTRDQQQSPTEHEEVVIMRPSPPVRGLSYFLIPGFIQNLFHWPEYETRQYITETTGPLTIHEAYVVVNRHFYSQKQALAFFRYHLHDPSTEYDPEAQDMGAFENQRSFAERYLDGCTYFAENSERTKIPVYPEERYLCFLQKIQRDFHFFGHIDREPDYTYAESLWMFLDMLFMTFKDNPRNLTYDKLDIKGKKTFGARLAGYAFLPFNGTNHGIYIELSEDPIKARTF